MDELELKLSSNSPTTVTLVFSGIIELIKKKQHENVKDCLQLKFLKEKCISNDLLVSDLAGRSILYLVEHGILSTGTIMEEFCAKIKSMKCHYSLVNILGSLLLFDRNFKQKTKTQFTVYNLCAPQHPFVTVLIEDATACNNILNRIMYFHDNKEKLLFSNDLFLPVYLFSLCKPVQNNSQNAFNQKLWKFLLKTCDTYLIYDLLSWFPLHNCASSEAVSDYLNEAVLYSKSTKYLNSEVLILLQVSHLYTVAQSRLDLSHNLRILREVLEGRDSFVTSNCIVLMLAKIIDITLPIYLPELLGICEFLIKKGVHEFVLATLKASLLPWLTSHCLLLENACNTILGFFKNTDANETYVTRYVELDDFIQQYLPLLSSNQDIFLTLQICRTLENIEENEFFDWLKDIDDLPYYFIDNIYHILCGLLMVNDLKIPTFKYILELILEYITKNAPSSQKLLTIMLYKLSNINIAELHFELLKALPKMMICRNNISKVMTTIEILSKGSPDLFNLSVSLAYEAWKIDNICYPHLENKLVRSFSGPAKWEFYVTKAHVIKGLCITKPHLYGKEMVPHLSRILNECGDDNGSLPSEIALQSIKILCEACIIDIVTTWKTLFPKFQNDTRLPVIKGLCSLMEVITEQSCPDASGSLTREMTQRLWYYVEVGDPDVSKIALYTLGKFSLEDICASMPEKYIGTEEEQKDSAILYYLRPGKVWISFLTEHRCSGFATNFVTQLIAAEIDGYFKHVYHVKKSREPLNYEYLPTHSVLRAIGDFVRSWVSKRRGSSHYSDNTYIECLKILSVEYSKPLPPLDWSFLQELIYDPDCKAYCIDIASHQVTLSGTARRLIENLIVIAANNPQVEYVTCLYRNMKYLAKSIQPMVLKPFIESSFTFAMEKYESSDRNFLQYLVDITIGVLQDDKVQETNKVTIAQVLTDQISITERKSLLLTLLLKCAVALPMKHLEKLTTFKSDSSEEWLDKVVELRCSIAMQSEISPLGWLNDVISLISLSERNSKYLDDIVKVFRMHINNAKECALWLVDFIGEIQAKVAAKSNQKEIYFYFDMFILIVLEFSGYSTLMHQYDKAQANTMFPSSFASLMESNEWSACSEQALEWLFHMNNEETVPKEYRRIFGITVRSLRHEDEFRKHERWMKYVFCRLDFD